MNDLAAIMETKLFYAGISFLFAYIGKVIWDYTKTGRIEKEAIYMTPASCQRVQKICSIGELKEKVSQMYTDLETFKVETRTHQQETDKRFDENLHTIRMICGDITSIKEAQAHSNALLEMIAETVKAG